MRLDAACTNRDADVATVEAALVAARELSGWVEARRATLIGRLAAVSSFPEATIADADRTSIGAASKARDRADTLAAMPRLAESLGDGATTAGHIVAVTRAANRAGEHRDELLERVDALADVAAAATVAEVARRVDLEAKRLERDDGEAKLERQRRATRLRSWVDGEGMWNLKGRFDPVTGLRVDARLRTLVDALFAEATPEHCPADPIERQQFLLAHALASLVDSGGGTSRSGRPEFVVVIDADATAPSPTQTSAIDTDIMADVTKRPQDVAGAHFFAPANVMKLCEVVRGTKSSIETIMGAMQMGRDMGKISAVAGTCDGFAANRSRAPFITEMMLMLEEGALPQQIDKVMVDFGYPLGPFAVNDISGLDISYDTRKRRAAADPDYRKLHVPDRLVEMGRKGQKTGAGWYRYEKGDRTPIPDDVVKDVIAGVAKEFGIEQRTFSDEEILRRLPDRIHNFAWARDERAQALLRP